MLMHVTFDSLKTFYNILLQKLKNYRGNWEQNDPTSDDYIKNRPFYSAIEETVLVDNLSDEDYQNGKAPGCNFVPGQSYDVIWNGVLYENLVCRFSEGYNVIACSDNGDSPFYIDDNGGDGLYISCNDGEWTVSIFTKQEVVHQIDAKYLPDMNYVSYDDAQTLTDDQMAQARENIGAGTSNFSGSYTELTDKPTIYTDVVRYSYQYLNTDQKAQVRGNIGAAADLDVIKSTTQYLADDQKTIARTNINAADKDSVYTKDEVYTTTQSTIIRDWDGNTDGIDESFVWNGETFYKISDDVIDSNAYVSAYVKHKNGTQAVNERNCGIGYAVTINSLPSAFIIDRAGSGSLMMAATQIQFTAPSAGIYVSEDTVRVSITYNRVQTGLYLNSVDESFVVGVDNNGVINTTRADGTVVEMASETYVSEQINSAIDGKVSYAEPQTLAPEQQAQARTNINAVSMEEVEELLNGNAEEELETVTIGLGESAPDETVASICDFTLTPTTMQAAYGLANWNVINPSGELYGKEVPTLTTKGTLYVKGSDGNVKYSKYIEPMFNHRGIYDQLTHKGLQKRWSKKFYLTKQPISTTKVSPYWDGALTMFVYVWEFDEAEFENTGIPAKLLDIPTVTACFQNDEYTRGYITNRQLYNTTPYPAVFSYNAETRKYTLTLKGIDGFDINHLLTQYSKVYFYYQLELPYVDSFQFAMGIEAGDNVIFDEDFSDAQPYIDKGFVYEEIRTGFVKEYNVTPAVSVLVPRNINDAMEGMTNVASILNNESNSTGGDAAAQGYSWIGDGDGITDYTARIQSKLDELHMISNGGTICLGHGTYPISSSLIVYDNTRIIGDGQTVIEQTADNTHALVISGNHITIRDVHIRLSGSCTEITSCIYTNANNAELDEDPNLPANEYCNFCTIENVHCHGEYAFSYENGGAVVSDYVENYRGVGIYCKGYFNWSDISIMAHNLFSAVYGSDANNCYKIYESTCGHAVYATGGGQNNYDISAHTYYSWDSDGSPVSLTKDAVYAEMQHNSHYTVRIGDEQYADCAIYFGTSTMINSYCVSPLISTATNSQYKTNYGNNDGGVITRAHVIDMGRGNVNVSIMETVPFGVGNRVEKLNGMGVPRIDADGAMANALSGAGIWGSISSNVEWMNRGIDLKDVCRYPNDEIAVDDNDRFLYILSQNSPTAESPIEIIIDVSERPIVAFPNLWIQFDYRYVGEDITISVDTNGNGEFDFVDNRCSGNSNTVFWYMQDQMAQSMIYRIKITITKAFSAESLTFQSSAHEISTINYNPDGLVGIVNIGMLQRSPFGRAFLGECGGSLYGNVDMHNNTLKNLPTPVDDGDAVSKAYVDERISGANDFILTDRTTGKKYNIYVDNGKLVMEEEVE
jgi:hypothetical protein